MTIDFESFKHKKYFEILPQITFYYGEQETFEEGETQEDYYQYVIGISWFWWNLEINLF